MIDLKGVFLPVTTPFRESDGSADEEAFRRNLRAYLETPVAGIVVAGSTGEAPLLEERELFLLVDAAREELPGDRTLVVGTGTESTRRTVALSREAAARGAEAVMVRPPYYYTGAMTADALLGHFHTVADASPVPVVLYHVPKYVSVGLPPDLVARLTRHENVAGIKDSSGDVKNLGRLVDACGEKASVLVGAGGLLYGALEMGATGGVLAVGCVAPREACEVYAAFREGDHARAGAVQETLGALNRAVVSRRGVPGVKHALELVGLEGGPPRPPLLPLDEAGRRAVEGAVKAAGLERAGAAAG